MTDSGQPVSFVIDGGDVLREINPEWRDFALANGGDILAGDLVGQSLWDLISDPAIRNIYKAVFEEVRATNRRFSYLYRCDSPATLRLLRMTLTPLPDGGIRLTSRAERIAPQDPQAHDRRQEEPGKQVAVCSVCHRVHLDDIWWLPSQALADKDLFVDDRPVTLTFKICEGCSRAMG